MIGSPTSSTNPYPTKDEILAHNQVHTDGDVNVLTMWKAEHYTKKWAGMDNKEKILSLAWLAKTLVPGVNITDGEAWKTELSGEQSPRIVMDKNHPSIISALHEVGHVLFGVSEHSACAYSVKLFAEVFPKEYADLIWKGHLLKKG